MKIWYDRLSASHLPLTIVVLTAAHFTACKRPDAATAVCQVNDFLLSEVRRRFRLRVRV